jgi:tRNA (guanine-N7-)-methyltransferase
MTDESHPVRAAGNFFGRRHGKPLRPHQSNLFEDLLPRLKIDLDTATLKDLRSLFEVPVENVRMEIGFGGGEHLHNETGRYPDTGFIGVEPFVNGMAKMLAALDEAPRSNLRLYDEDATAVLDWLPDASLVGIDLFYPDPWHKRRHWKRRFVSDENLGRFARVLKPVDDSVLLPISSITLTGHSSIVADMTLLNGRQKDHPTGTTPMRAGQVRATRPRLFVKAAVQPI